MTVSSSIQTVLWLFLIFSAVAIAVKWIRIPYWIGLVIAGLVVGLLKLFPAVVLSRDLILLIFLPPLLFEGAWNLQVKNLKRNWLPISVLSTVGVVISIIVTAYLLHVFGPLNLYPAFLVAAMVSATDPISVLAIFRKMGINKDLTMILEGESIFNDCTALVAFSLVLSAMDASSQTSVASTVSKFGVLALGGIFVGSVTGLLASKIASWCGDHLLEITLTIMVAYGSFIVAEELGFSPIIAVVTAALLLRNLRHKDKHMAEFASAVESFWEYISFAVNSLVFLLIGMQVNNAVLSQNSRLIGVGIIALLVSRALVVYTLSPLLSGRPVQIPYAWRHILVWGGLRGALPIAMALSLPQGMLMREELIVLTLGLVVFTLLVPGLTIEPLVSLLKLERGQKQLAGVAGAKDAAETIYFEPHQSAEAMQGKNVSFGAQPAMSSITRPESISAPANGAELVGKQ
jgi:CPA1 family monovalent cation:H+ antiporter